MVGRIVECREVAPGDSRDVALDLSDEAQLIIEKPRSERFSRVCLLQGQQLVNVTAVRQSECHA